MIGEPPGVAFLVGELEIDRLVHTQQNAPRPLLIPPPPMGSYKGGMGRTPVNDVIKVAEFRAALRRFLRHTETVSGRHGLTPQRYLLLLMIKGAPDGTCRSTVTQLAERLQLAQHTVTELVARTEESGLIGREASSADRRVSFLKLTAKGDTLLARVMSDLEGDRQYLESLVASLAFH